jgi:hypothetical protein
MIKVGPHAFKALKIWDGWSENGRCLHCKLPKSAHPVRTWVPARPLKDKSEAEFSEENWAGK